MKQGAALSSRRHGQTRSRVERRRQRLTLLQHRTSYWQEVESLRLKWQLPDGGFRLSEAEDESEHELRFLARVEWESRMAEQLNQEPTEALWQDVERLNRKHQLPRSDDYIVCLYLLDGEVAGTSVARTGPTRGYDPETREPFAHLPIGPDLTLQDVKDMWEMVEEARSWLSDRLGEPATRPRVRRNFARDLFIWKAVNQLGQTYEAAYDEWLREHPYDEPVETSAIIHAVQALDREIGE